MGKLKKDVTGKRFGNRTVLCRGEKKNGRIRWRTKCDCGHMCDALLQTLKRSKGCPWCSHKEDRPYRRLRPYEAQYNAFKNRARYPVEITYERFAKLAEQKHCHYCESPVVWSEYRGATKNGGNGSNLDRKDYRLGYTLGNVAVCCRRCNYAKGTHFSYQEWKEIGRLIKTWDKKATQPITPFSQPTKRTGK